MDDYFRKIFNFFRPYFKTNEEVDNFINTVYKIENDKFYDDSNEISEEDEIYLVPRRLVNTVERFVTVAEDMEKIRPGQDTYKVIFLVVCIERMYMLSGSDIKHKWEIINDFFEHYFSSDDKQEISENIWHNDDDYGPISIIEFAKILNTIRNNAMHEGEFWDIYFNNSYPDYNLLVNIEIDLENFTRNNKKSHMYKTRLSFNRFKEMFVRACIKYILEYV
jgi:hypothetical protein